MAIRYDLNLKKEIKRTITNFNSKVRRLEKQQKLVVLPPLITKKEIGIIGTRQELKRKLKQLKLFSKRGIEENIFDNEGLIQSKYENIIMKQNLIRAKKLLTRKINVLAKTKPNIYGKEQVLTFEDMADQRLLNLQAQRKALEKDLTKLTQEEYQRFKNLIEKVGKLNPEFRNKFIENFTLVGKKAGYNKEKMKAIEKKLSKLTNNQFIDLYNKEQSVRTVMDYYLLTKSELGKDLKGDIDNLYENIYENIDEIIGKS